MAATAGREFAEETLGLYGGADVNAATVKASAETMAGRLRAAVGAAGGGGGDDDGGERRTNPLRTVVRVHVYESVCARARWPH